MDLTKAAVSFLMLVVLATPAVPGVEASQNTFSNYTAAAGVHIAPPLVLGVFTAPSTGGAVLAVANPAVDVIVAVSDNNFGSQTGFTICPGDLGPSSSFVLATPAGCSSGIGFVYVPLATPDNAVTAFVHVVMITPDLTVGFGTHGGLDATFL